MGYMMSCNYYPKPKAGLSEGQNNLRLSAHPDVSLLTTFPYGVSKGLSYFDDNKRFEVGEKKGPISFFGYFANFFSNGAIEPLEHQVESPKDFDIERFSFALFSIPKPDSTFTIGDREITGKDYYMQYLSLF